MNTGSDKQPWAGVLQFWFPEGRSLKIDAVSHRDHWFWRLQGGADGQILTRFSDLTAEAAKGNLRHWGADPDGRLALIILLDQFSRSVWRGSRRAFAQDPDALALAMHGLSIGHYTALSTPWHRIVYSQPLGHCEGPAHLERIDSLVELREAVAADAPAHLRPIYKSLVTQAHHVRKVIKAFGRHPHRNQILGRKSTPAEEAYVAEGNFSHERAFR